MGWIDRLLGREQQQRESTVSGPLIPPRGRSGLHGSVSVTESTALRHSAVWACVDITAKLISTFPVDVFRKFEGLQVEMPMAPILVDPGGQEWDYQYWMYASQHSLSLSGNAIGIITERNGLGLPARIDLQAHGDCSVIQRRGEAVPKYRVAGKEYDRDKIWHERLYVVPGLPVGLSPVAHAAWTIAEDLSIQQFANDWFSTGGIPKARLRNTKRTVPPREAALVKERWAASVLDGDLFVHGSDWEYNLTRAEAMGAEWLDAQRFNLPAISRVFRVPADLIDAAISAPGTVTYQSALERNLQYLVVDLGSVVTRRERNLSKLLPRPRFVKLNTDALLRMDPKTRQEVTSSQIEHRQLTVTEARALDNRPPLTADQEAEFVRLFGAPKAPAGDPALRAAVDRLWQEPGQFPDPEGWADDAVRGPTNGRVPDLATVGGAANGHRRGVELPWLANGSGGSDGGRRGQ